MRKQKLTEFEKLLMEVDPPGEYERLLAELDRPGEYEKLLAEVTMTDAELQALIDSVMPPTR